MKNKSRKENGIKEKKTHTRVTTDCKVKKLEDGKSKADSKAKYFPARVDDESDQLEKSDLTKELEQPSCSGSISHSPECCSQISKKRERQDSLVNGSKSERATFRIRLPLGKHREPDSSLSEHDKNYRSTESATCAQERMVSGHSNSQTIVELAQPKPTLCLMLPLSAREKTETRRAKETSLYINEIQHAELAYKTLIENWIPGHPMHQLWQNDFDDQDWPFGSRKQQDKQESKRHKTGIEISRSRSSSLWQQAEYLSEVGICALPYAVPF